MKKSLIELIYSNELPERKENKKSLMELVYEYAKQKDKPSE
ncbi:hypothetical protein [Priestia megaterium]|nr:hypothetical protein [Priestia megaterium]